MIIVEGEYLEGFHFERVPQLSNSNSFDMNALSPLAGMRAVWLLYLLGKWEHLEDLGVSREEVEPVLKQFSFGKRLTPRQAQQLYRNVPDMRDASRELRLAYALKQVQRKEKGMVIYHAEVPAEVDAEALVKGHEAEMRAAGGSIELGYNRQPGSRAIIMIKLPDQPEVNPANLLPGSGLRFSRVRAQVVKFQKGEEQ